jgi:hypothetical protein
MFPVKATTRYLIECFAPDGSLRWRDGFDNLVVTQGLNKLLDATFTANGFSAYFVGLKAAGAVVAADTLASHAGWAELSGYTGNRQAWTPNAAAAAGAISNSAAKAVYPVTADATIAGAFLASVATGTSGVLYGAGDFSSARPVLIGDTLNVQVDVSVTG